jgi:aminodeoxyfutalosine deaminase
MEFADFVTRLPKVELHLHLIGAAPPSAVVELARRSPELGVPTDLDQLREHYEYTDFLHFIEIYKSVSDLVRTADDLAFLAVAVARDLAAQSARYAEVTVTPALHLRRGMAAEDIRDGLNEGARRARLDHGVELRWCYDIPSGGGQPTGMRTVRLAAETPPDGLVSLGLAGAEQGYPRSVHREAFEQARSLGLHSVPHAGEAAGADHVWQAITDLRAERVGHGIRAIDDPRLIDVLVQRNIALEICPTSNVRTRVIDSWAHHPLRALLDVGVLVTLNADDPAMFGTSLVNEYATAASALGLSRDELVTIARHGVDASFMSAQRKRSTHAEIDRHVEQDMADR